MNDWLGRAAPDLETIEAMARATVADLPERFAAPARGVMIRVEDFPDSETEEEMDLDSPFDLLGLYRGSSMLHKSVSDSTPQIDLIFLYRRPILDLWCESSDDLLSIVRHVLIHEIGHHFGFSDADMERLEDEAVAADESTADYPRA